MSGQPTPTKMVEAFAVNALPANITSPFPAASQIPLGNPGKASLNDGFPPLNLTPLVAGGIPPSGADMNGILNLLSQTVAAVDAGQHIYPFDAVYAAAIGGYAQGARVADATLYHKVWISAIAANSTDPAVHPENWISSVPLYSTSAPGAGTHTDNVLSGPSDYVLDIDTTTGNVELDGFVAQRDGQTLVICNIGANVLNLGVNLGAAANRIRASGGPLTILQNDSLTIRYVSAISRWVQV